MNENFKKDLINAIRYELRGQKEKVKYLEIDKHYANESTIGFIEMVQEMRNKRISTLERKLRFLTDKKIAGEISDVDIERAKQTKISTLVKVPSSKKVLCLFHTDKVPSMHIYETTYHCFSCGAHGSVIDIVMKLYGLKFIDAVKRLL